MVRRADPVDIPSVPKNAPIEELINCLKSLHTQQPVRLYFKDGREETGFVTYIARTGNGRYINRINEVSGTFNVHSLAAIDTDVEF